MKLIIDQSPEHSEVKITIECGLIDADLERLIEQVRMYSFSITGKNGGRTYTIRLEDIYYFESIDEKTFFYCEKDVYECEYRLYELESRLARTNFARISKSCILNINHLHSVKALLNGKLEAELVNGEHVIINRHYVQAVKEKLDL